MRRAQKRMTKPQILEETRPAVLPVTAAALGEAKCYNTRQSLHLEQSFRCSSGHTLRARICRDSYDFQSSALMEVLDPQTLKWSVLASLSYAMMSSSRNGYHKPGSAAQDGLERDVRRLLSESLVLITAVSR